LLSFIITNQPFRVWAWLTVPVVIEAVADSYTSLISKVPSGNFPVLRNAAMVPGVAYTSCICFEPGSLSAATAQVPKNS
jgi:hypothetical protein